MESEIPCTAKQCSRKSRLALVKKDSLWSTVLLREHNDEDGQAAVNFKIDLVSVAT